MIGKSKHHKAATSAWEEGRLTLSVTVATEDLDEALEEIAQVGWELHTLAIAETADASGPRRGGLGLFKTRGPELPGSRVRSWLTIWTRPPTRSQDL